MTDETGELILPEFALSAATHGAGAKGEPGYLDARLAERHPISCFASRCLKRQYVCPGQHASGQSCIQKSASGTNCHQSILRMIGIVSGSAADCPSGFHVDATAQL
jgi:hypothetical protein